VEQRDYLNPQSLAAIAGIELRARMIVEGLMQGMHRSPHQGISVEFAQHRPYVAGDDLRHLDWKVYGRSDKLYLKQYQQETNLDLVLLCDCSGSMGYSSSHHPAARGTNATSPWSKFDCGASLAAAMAYLSLRQQDRVALWLFDDHLIGATRLSNAQGHWRNVVELLAQTRKTAPTTSALISQNDENGNGVARTDLSYIFDRITATVSQRSLFVLISDLFDDPEVLERGLARLHHRRHDVILMQTLDPAELSFPFRSPTEFLGLEAEGKLPVDPAALRKAYLDVLNEHQSAVQRMTRRFRFDHLQVDTSQSVGPPLSHFLARRTASIAKD